MNPTLSIVMPVFDTGRLLLESVRSIIGQTLFAVEAEGYWELLIVDDASGDAETQRALDEACALSPAVTVLQNRRSKGVAGARNTGIFAARGDWIGFLDSDDLWYPDFLARQRDAFVSLPEAAWRAAHFDAGDETAQSRPLPLSHRSPCLYGHISEDYVGGRVSRLQRPVDVMLRCGCMQVMTVQVRRELMQVVGGFDETLACAEDYDLWLRLAVENDLYLAPIDAGIYRIRGGSLTKSGRPMYYEEDRMLRKARANRAFDPYRVEIDRRLQRVYSTFCYHYRGTRSFDDAKRHALRLIRSHPFRIDGWRHLVAATLRR